MSNPKSFLCCLLGIYCFLASATVAMAGSVALVIGVSDYANDPLRTPTRDATAVGQALSAAGWDPTVITNVPKSAIAEALSELAEKLPSLSGDDMVLIYFSGHGFQLGGVNYLLLPGNHSSLEAAIRNSLSTNEVFDALKATKAARVLLLDACRSSPLGQAQTLRLSNGLTQISAPTNTVIGFAAAPSQAAFDGLDSLSPYASAIVAAIPESKSLDDFFRSVRRHTILSTRGAQVPWETSSLVQLYLFRSIRDAGHPPPEQRTSSSRLTAESSAQAELYGLGIDDPRFPDAALAYVISYLREMPLSEVYRWDGGVATELDRQDFIDTINWQNEHESPGRFWGNFGYQMVTHALNPACRDDGRLIHDCVDFDRSVYVPLDPKLMYHVNAYAYAKGGRTDGLAMAYENGIFVEKDLVKAYDIYLDARNRPEGQGTFGDYVGTSVNQMVQKVMVALGKTVSVDGDFGPQSCRALQELIGEAPCGRMIDRESVRKLAGVIKML